MGLTYLNVAKKFPYIALTSAIVTLLLSPITIVGNSLVLFSILCDPFQNIRRTPSSCIIFSLALADFFVGALLEPLFTVYSLYSAIKQMQPFPMYVISSTVYVLQGVSICSLVVLSFDRLRAIATPLQYACTASRKKMRNVLILIWIYFTALGISEDVFKLNFNPIWNSLIIAHTVTILVVLITFNVAVVRSVRIRGRNIKKMVDSENTTVMQSAFSREKAVTRTTGILVLAFLICVLPFFVFAPVYFLLEDTYRVNFNEMHPWMYVSVINLMCLNSLMNPFLYAWRLPKYRKAFRYIFIHVKNKITISTSQWSESAPSSRRAEHIENEYRVKPHSLSSRSRVTCSPKVPQTLCHSMEDGSKENTDKETRNEINTSL